MAKEEEEGRMAVLATIGTALEIVDWGDDAGSGLENIGEADKQVSLLRKAHYSCPQRTDGDPKYIPGLGAGYIFNIATGDYWNGTTGLDVVVCGTKKRFLAWIPRRKEGQLPPAKLRSGNFRGFHEPTEELVRHLVDRYGNNGQVFGPLPYRSDEGEDVQLIETGEMLIMYGAPPLTMNNAEMAVLNLDSTSIGVWRKFNKRVTEWTYPKEDGRRQRAPIFGLRWRLTTQPAVNPLDSSQKYFVWSLELPPEAEGNRFNSLLGRQDPDLFVLAREACRRYGKEALVYEPDDDKDDGVAVGDDRDEVPF